MVVTSLPSARDTGATQDRIASPLRWTVQAPHCAMPQPYLVPVRPRFSRRTQSRGVEGSTSRLTRCRFTLNKIIGTPPESIRGCDCEAGKKCYSNLYPFAIPHARVSGVTVVILICCGQPARPI